jgi:hypothetical protein
MAWVCHTGPATESGGTPPRFDHKFSPQRFTLPQLAACVLLKEYRRFDGRGLEALLQLSPPLRRCLGLKRVPDYSTLWRFAGRWLQPPRLSDLLARVLERLGLQRVEVAVDSTGMNPSGILRVCQGFGAH